MHADRLARIRQRAHDLWKQEGRPEGRARDHWLRAEAEIVGSGEDEKRMTTKDSISVVRDLLLISVVILFFAGWLFAHYFHGQFAIAAYTADIPVHAFYFYSINIPLYIVSAWRTIVVVAIIALILLGISYMIFMRTYRTAFYLAVQYRVLLILGGFSVILMLMFPVAQHAALAAAQLVRDQTYPLIQFEFKKGGALKDANVPQLSFLRDGCSTSAPMHIENLCKGNRNYGLIPITETSDYFVVMYRPDPSIGDSAIYRIPKSEVVLAITP